MMRVAGHRIRLTEEHLVWMRVPKRFWPVTFDDIQEAGCRETLRAYLRSIDTMLDEGNGLLLMGENGTGKTCAAVVVMKEARRCGASGLFITAESLRQGILNKEKFGDDMLIYDRAERVDLLLLDDLAKEVEGESEWARRTLENLLRVRSAHRRTTLITTNANREKLLSKYGNSLIEVLKETCLPILLDGESRRNGDALRAKLATG